jgi:hypothetical protein
MLALCGQLLNCVASSAIAADPAGVMIDVSLTTGGVLSGQVLDGEGQPKSGERIAILFENQPVAVVRADEHGEFHVRGLHSGIHVVSTSEGSAPFRFWAPSTAPPNVPAKVLLVKEGTVVRGKSQKQHAIAHLLSNPYVLIGAAAVAIIVPAAINGNGTSGRGSGS